MLKYKSNINRQEKKEKAADTEKTQEETHKMANFDLNNSNLEFLFKTIMELRSMEECEKYFTDLCTIPELKSISQRAVVAKMLDEKRNYQDIVEQTGASTATISRVNRSLQYGAGGYRIIFDRLEEQE